MKYDDVRAGTRVALHPGTTLWIRGVRYAQVIKLGRDQVTIESDTGKRYRVAATALLEEVPMDAPLPEPPA